MTGGLEGSTLGYAHLNAVRWTSHEFTGDPVEIETRSILIAPHLSGLNLDEASTKIFSPRDPCGGRSGLREPYPDPAGGGGRGDVRLRGGADIFCDVETRANGHQQENAGSIRRPSPLPDRRCGAAGYG